MACYFARITNSRPKRIEVFRMNFQTHINILQKTRTWILFKIKMRLYFIIDEDKIRINSFIHFGKFKNKILYLIVTTKHTKSGDQWGVTRRGPSSATSYPLILVVVAESRVETLIILNFISDISLIIYASVIRARISP